MVIYKFFHRNGFVYNRVAETLSDVLRKIKAYSTLMKCSGYETFRIEIDHKKVGKIECNVIPKTSPEADPAALFTAKFVTKQQDPLAPLNPQGLPWGINYTMATMATQRFYAEDRIIYEYLNDAILNVYELTEQNVRYTITYKWNIFQSFFNGVLDSVGDNPAMHNNGTSIYRKNNRPYVLPGHNSSIVSEPFTIVREYFHKKECPSKQEETKIIYPESMTKEAPAPLSSKNAAQDEILAQEYVHLQNAGVSSETADQIAQLISDLIDVKINKKLDQILEMLRK